MIRGEVYTTTTVIHGYRVDPAIVATVFGVASVVFLILAIVVPAFMVKNAQPVICAPTDVLFRNAQTVCRPPKARTYIGLTESKAAPYVKYYRMKQSAIGTTRERVHNYVATADLAQGPMIIPVMSSAGAVINLDVHCVSGKCDSVKLYWLNKVYFDEANETGTFDENLYGWRKSDFSQRFIFYENLGMSTCIYLVFANKNEPAKISVDGTMTYTVYNMNQMEPIDCKKEECVFEKMETNEIIVMDYVDNEGKSPEKVYAQINSVAESYVGAVIFAIIFGLLCLAALAVLILFVLQKLGKISLFKGQASSVPTTTTDDDSLRYEAPQITVEHVPNSVIF